MIVCLRYFFSIILCTLYFGISAQSFSVAGKVVDINNNPIELATIVILEEDGSTFIKGVSTDTNGLFMFENVTSGTYFIKISFIGFQKFEQIIILKGNLNLRTIRLNANSENLNEVVVIGRKPTITRKPDRLIFNIENTALTQGSTLGVLKNTPGVIVTEEGINIKSAPATIYINNRRVQLTNDELIQLLESSPANSIKSIEVITNPPASYDAESGSVINIVMSKNLVTGYRGSLFANYTQGVFPRYNVGTSHYFKNNKFSLNVNYSYTNKKINRDQDDTVNYLDNANAIDQIYQSNINRNTLSETHNLNLNFDYFIDVNNTLSFTSTGLYVPNFEYKINNRTIITDANDAFLSSFTADNLSRDDKYNVGSNLIFKHNFDNSASLTFDGHFTIYDYERDQNVFQDNLDIPDSEFNTLANQDTQIITGKADYNLPINETVSFDAGAKYSNVNTDSNITRLDIINGDEVLNVNNTDAFRYDETVYAAYSNFSKSWDKWNLSFGLRVEQTNVEGESLTLNEINIQDYFNLFPNVSLSHEITENLNIYGNYKRSITRPSYTDLNPFTFFINENTVVLGNPNLIPSYRDHFDIGIDFLKHFTVSAYYDNYDGDIVELPRQNNETNIIAFTPTNLDKKVEYGFDFIFQKSVTDNYFIYAVTSFYNITEESNFGDGFVEQSQWSNYSILQNTLSFLDDNSLNINLTMYWVGKNLQQFQTVENRLVSELSMSKSILKKKGVISLGINDIFNMQDYETSLRYLDQSSRSAVDIDNRSIKLGFRYNFGNTKLNTNERTTDEEQRDRIKDLE